MTTESDTDTEVVGGGSVVHCRLSAEEATALRWLRALHVERYAGISSVLRDYSLDGAVATYRRAQAMAGAGGAVT